MIETKVAFQVAHRWYSRPVFFVADVNRALRFYIDMLGFEKAWHSEDGTGTVCQVNRSDCEIILCQDATRTDRGWWGYDVIRIDDPDGNELLFPFPE